MADKTSARMAASLAAALSSRFPAIEAANQMTDKADKDWKIKKAAEGATGNSYVLVLKGSNEFAARGGVTGAAAAKIDGSQFDEMMVRRKGAGCQSIP